MRPAGSRVRSAPGRARADARKGSCRGRPRPRGWRAWSRPMSQPSIEQFYPGLEGVVAAETAISSIEGGTGRACSSIAAIGSRTSPRRSATRRRRSCSPRRPARPAQLREFDGRLRAARGLPDDLTRCCNASRGRQPDGRAADVGERPGPLRSRPRTPRRPTTPPTSARPSG